MRQQRAIGKKQKIVRSTPNRRKKRPAAREAIATARHEADIVGKVKVLPLLTRSGPNDEMISVRTSVRTGRVHGSFVMRNSPS